MTELKQKSSDPGIWQDPKAASQLLRELKTLETIADTYNRIADKCTDLIDLAKLAISENEPDVAHDIPAQCAALAADIDKLELQSYLSGPYDAGDAILSITAGAGGTDAQDWAQILFRMYSRFFERQGYQTEIADMSYGEEAGLKGATLFVRGPYAYGHLKSEQGIHRLVRISPFDANKRRHTSFAAVDLLPDVGESVQVDIKPDDLRIDTFRAGGHGGQNVQKVESAIRIIHIPTGITAQCQSERSQHQNKETAMKILKARLYERMLAEHKERIEELRGTVKDIAWGNQIRSYVFHPYTMAKDHRTGFEVGDVQRVIDGDLEPLVENFLRSHKAQGRKP